MTADTAAGPVPPASTHDDAIALFRRPFAPGAVGFRAMSKVPWNHDPWGGAQVAAYIGAQSVLQRLNYVVPGRWRMSFAALDGDLLAAADGGECGVEVGADSGGHAGALARVGVERLQSGQRAG